MSNILTFTCFDSFGLGALLSWQITYNRIPKFFIGLSIVATIVLLFSPLNLIPLRTVVSVISLWVISYIVLNQDHLKFKFILNNRVLIFLGKISYGLYLYHNIFPELISTRIIEKYIYIPQNYHWIENGIILIGMSWLSYTLIETRFLNLKKKYPMTKKNTLQHSTVSPNVSISEALN